MRILGIDPGTRLIGFGVLDCARIVSLQTKDYKVVDAGVLRTDPKSSSFSRIGAIHQAMYEIAIELKPDLCVIESAFFGCNPQSALKLGQARGALMAAMSRCAVPVKEIAPTKVKKIITGNGHGDKEAISLAITRLLQFKRGRLPLDVTDALAIALSYGISGENL